MSFQPPTVDVDSVESAAVLASWLDSPCHLVKPPSAEQVASVSPSGRQTQPAGEFTIDSQRQQQGFAAEGDVSTY
jgi:hypothetical protein